MDHIEVSIVSEPTITEQWWFQLLAVVLSATIASLLTYIFTKRVAKKSEITQTIASMYSEMRIHSEAYFNFLEYDRRTKSSMKKYSGFMEKGDSVGADLSASNARIHSSEAVSYKKTYEAARARLNADSKILGSLLTNYLSKTDYHSYIDKIMKTPHENLSYGEAEVIMNKNGEQLERLLTTLNYKNNNAWIVTTWNIIVFIAKNGHRSYLAHSGKRYKND